MRYFKLKALSCSGKGNRVLRKVDNEVYREGAFHNPEALMASGHIYEVDKNGQPMGSSQDLKETAKDEPTADTGSVLDSLEDAFNADTDDQAAPEVDGNPYADADVDDYKLAEWKELADAAGIEYKTRATRQEILDLLIDHYSSK